MNSEAKARPARLRVTFDTNVLDWACRPERFPKNPLNPLMQKVHGALARGEFEGFYSVTMLTIEGIQRQDRADVFAGTRITSQPEKSSFIKNADLPAEVRKIVGNKDVYQIQKEFRVEQPGRKPLHPEVVARVQAAKALGVKVLKTVPRMGGFHFTDEQKDYYLDPGDGSTLSKWIATITELARIFEERGVGIAQLKSIGNKLGASDPAAIWYQTLDRAADIHGKRAVERAFSEWADADSMAAHIAYGLDVFCSADVGNSNVNASILDPQTRAWLTSTYGVRFMTFAELAASLPDHTSSNDRGKQ